MTDPVLTVSDAARDFVLALLRTEDEPETLGLRAEITGDTGREFVYDLTFQVLADTDGDDLVAQAGELTVVVPAASVEDLRGATLDHVEPTGLVIRNPNRPRPAVRRGGPVLVEGSVEFRVQKLLDEEINPMLEQHSGWAALDHVEGDAAYLVMGGGCQGCGLAAATLAAGIEQSLVDSIPEIARVVDVTNHSEGTTPYYDPATV